MREIKFRVYGKENGFMYGWDELLTMDSFKDHMMFAASEDRYYSPLMQYTGLKDKNGKEIYEGDVLKTESKTSPSSPKYASRTIVKYHRVGWHQDGCWNKFKGLTDDHVGLTGVFQPHRWCEVVGNIYENPELLEVSQ